MAIVGVENTRHPFRPRPDSTDGSPAQPACAPSPALGPRRAYHPAERHILWLVQRVHKLRSHNTQGSSPARQRCCQPQSARSRPSRRPAAPNLKALEAFRHMLGLLFCTVYGRKLGSVTQAAPASQGLGGWWVVGTGGPYTVLAEKLPEGWNPILATACDVIVYPLLPPAVQAGDTPRAFGLLRTFGLLPILSVRREGRH